MSRGIRVVLHAVIAESLKMPNSCFAMYSTMSVCRARVHILRSLKSLSFDIYVCLSRSIYAFLLYSQIMLGLLSILLQIHTQIENFGCQIADL